MTLLTQGHKTTWNTPPRAGHFRRSAGTTRRGGAFIHEAVMKQDHIFEPPVMSRPFASGYHAIMQQAGEVNAEITKNEKMNIRRALEIGRLLLRAKPMANGDWEKTLEENGISHQRASEFMWGASQPLEGQEKWESIGDLRRARAAQSEQKRQTQSETATGGSSPPPKSTNPAAGALAPTVKPAKLCEACARRGYQIGCEDCKRLNGARIPKKAPDPTPENPREPGADDGELDAAADKYEEAQLKKVFRSWFGEIKKIAKAYGLKWGQKINESDSRFQKPFSLHCKARDALRDLLRQLAAERKPQEIPE